MDTAEKNIIDAAYEVILKKGLGNTRMKDISDHAGISRTTLNYYFRSRDKLIYKVLGDIMKSGMPEMTKTLNSSMGLFEKIEKFVVQYVDSITKNPFMPLFLINQFNHGANDFIEDITATVKPNIEGFKTQVYEETAKGNIIAIDPMQLYMNMISLCTYPIIGYNLFEAFTNTSEKDMEKLLKERRTQIGQLIINSIKTR